MRAFEPTPMSVPTSDSSRSVPASRRAAPGCRSTSNAMRSASAHTSAGTTCLPAARASNSANVALPSFVLRSTCGAHT